MSRFLIIFMLSLWVACGEGSAGPDAAGQCDLPLVFEKSPEAALEGSGWHRIYVQGGSAAPLPDGRFGMSEHRTQIASGDHFLLSAGTLVEFIYPVRSPVTGNIALHLARVDDPNVTARYELFLVRGEAQTLLFSHDDESSGELGYVPFERCTHAEVGGQAVAVGDYLLMRVTNLSGGMLGVVIRSPDYFTWIDVEVQ